MIPGIVLLLAWQTLDVTADPTTVLPQGGNFVAGSGSIGSPVQGGVSITQSSSRGVIDWKNFSIGSAGRVTIDNGTGATLNRVTGDSLSRIDGMLTATGSAYLINRNGVVVGPGGRVLTGGGFVASTRDVSNDAFMKGGALTASGTSPGTVVNQGSITASNGDVVLIGQAVENSGTVAAPNGTATLASGNRVVMTTVGGPSGVYVAADAAATGSVTQTGKISAAAVALRAAGGNVYTLAGNRSGIITATGTRTIQGEVWLVAPQGQVVAGGDIAARNSDGTGGHVVANGDGVSVASNARIAATGTSGGSVLIGISAAGSPDLAHTTTVTDGASIQAGGPSGGGKIETSGHTVSIGRADIQAGVGGQWLVDPVDLTIDTAAAATIVSSLNAGTDVTQVTTATSASGAGVQTPGAGDIVVSAPITWTGSGALTLTAFNDLNINAVISGNGGFTGTAGGAITVAANVSAANVLLTSTGDLTLGAGVTVTGTTGVTLGTESNFINNAGAGALSSGSGSWLVYSTNPASDVTGGLTPAFLQYAAPGGTAPAASGNGLLYSVAPSLSVVLSGTVSKVYDGNTDATFTGANAAVSGLINSDVAVVTGSYASKNAGTDLAVTATAIAVTHGGVPVFGYSGISPSVSANIGTITRATLTASIIGNPSKVYNGSTSASLSSANYALDGFAPGEGATVLQASTVAYDSPNAGARTLTATLVASNLSADPGTNLVNYFAPTSATGAGQITPAPLLIQGVQATNKVYDQTTADTLNTGGATLFGIVGTDNVSLITSGAVGTFATPNVGTDISVAASGFTLGGTAAGNYALVQPSGLTANITPLALTITGVAVLDKVYDGTTAATLDISSATLNGVLSGDIVTVGSGSSSNFATADAGTSIAVSVSGVSLTGAQASNYTVSSPSGLTGNITRRPVSVTIIGVPTKTYDGNATAFLTSANYQMSGLVAGETGTVPQSAQSVYDTAAAGARTVTATLTASDFVPGPNTKRSNYILQPTTVTGPGQINPAAIIVQIVGNPTKTFDGNNSASLTSGNYTLSGFLAGDGATITQTAGTYASSNVGLWQVTAVLAAGDFSPTGSTAISNYALPSAATGFGTIVRQVIGPGVIGAAITGNPTKVYDGNTIATLTPADYTLSGFAPGDGATITQTVGTYAVKNAGSVPVTVNLAPSDFLADPGTDLSNYELPTQAFGTGTINPAILTAAIIGNPTKFYNGTTAASVTSANFQILGFVSGEGATIATAAANYDLAQAGARTVSASFVSTQFVADSGTFLLNYVLPTTATGPGTITPAVLSIPGVSALDKTYDTTTAATLSTGSAQLFGVVGSDSVTLSVAGATGTFATANVGTGIAVTTSGFSISGADAGNYTLLQPVGLTAAITRAPLSITGIAALDKQYDSTDLASLSTGSSTLVGVLPADIGLVVLDVSGASGTFASVNVASNIAVSVSGAVVAGAQASNYALSQPGGLTASITPRALTATIIGNPTKAYDGSTSVNLTVANYQLQGFVIGQGATIIQSATQSYAAKDAGTQTVTAAFTAPDFVANSGTNLANYALPVSGSGPGTITQAQLAAAIINNPTKIYDATTSAVLTSANFILGGFATGEGATVTQTAGLYNSVNVGSRDVTAALAGGDFTANGGTNLANYILPTSASGIGTITQAMLQVIGVLATSRAYNGGFDDILDVSNANVAGLLGSDTVVLNSGAATGTFAQKDVGTAIPVTATGFTISGGQSANYMLAQPTGLAADITQALLTLINIQRIYDSTTALPTASGAYTLSGIFGSDSVAVDTSGISGSYVDKNVGNGKIVNVAGLALMGAQAFNYTIAPVVTNGPIGTITPAPLTATGVLGVDKVYDGTTAAQLNTGAATLSGLFIGDSVTLDSSGATGTFNNKNVGINKPVATSGFTISGLDAGNYNFTQPTGVTASITAFPFLTLDSVSKIYDGTNDLPTASSGYVLGGIIGSDDVFVADSSADGSYGDKNVGTGKLVTVTALNLAGTDAGNYLISLPISDTIGTITAKQLSVSIIGNPTKVYDRSAAATLSSGNYDLTGFTAGEGATITQVSGTYDSANAGPRTVTAGLAFGDFNPNGVTDLSNYILPASASGSGTITQAPLTILGVTATDKVYDGNTNDPLNTASATLSGIVSGDEGTVTLDSSGATGTFADPNVDTNIVVTAAGFIIAGANAGNYSLSQPTGLSADITEALLTLISVSKVYTATDAAVGAGVSYTLSGIVGSDAVFVDTGGLSGTYDNKNVGTGKAVSLTGLALSGAQAGNYSIAASVTNAPIGIITPATLTITGAVASGKVYDGTTAAVIDNSAAQLVGVLGSDSVTPSGPGSGTFASANVGTWAVTPNSLYTISGADAGNYSLVQPTGFSATISPALLTASVIGNPAKTYDGLNSATLTSANYAISGFVTGEGATVTQASGSYDSANAGARTVSVSLSAGDFTANGGTSLANYTLPTSASGAGTIDPKSLTAAIIGNPTKTYDGQDSATLTPANYAISGFVSGEGATVSQAGGTYDSANAGARTVTAMLAAGNFTATGATNFSNYILPVTASGAGAISPKTLTISIVGNPTRTYDGTMVATLTSANYLVTGLVGSDGGTINQTAGVYDSANAGARTVTVSFGPGDITPNAGTLASNYVLPSTATGAGTISAKLLTASITGNPTKVYDGLDTATLTSTNYALSGFVSGEGATVTQTFGTYDSANAGPRSVSASLVAGNFTAHGGTNLPNYVLPVAATGAGTINTRALTVTIIGNPTRTYDGTAAATLTAANYRITGFAGGEGAIINQPSGTYDSANAGARTVTANFTLSDVTGLPGTLASNYTFPLTATGAGTITPKTLTVAIIGNPTKIYDATTAAILTSANYSLGGFIAGESATVTQTSGIYDSANAGARTVTATLAGGDFAAGGGTLLANYVLPVSASGAGEIDSAQLFATIIGNPTKTYDGLDTATLTPANYALSGFASGEGATVNQTLGSYDSVNAGARSVTATLSAGDFTAAGATSLANYILPATAVGAGTISPKALTVAIIGNPTRAYDGTTSATLTAANYQISGFVGSDGATINQTSGSYDSANVGARTVTASFTLANITGVPGTLASNYTLPLTATGAGQINPAQLVATIIGDPTKIYDGLDAATLTSANYALSGFAAGEGATVNQTSGTYDSPNAGGRIVTAALSASDLVATGPTSFANYILPTTASGAGTISPKALTVAIVGNPTRAYDGTRSATLTAANYQVTGFVGTDGATINQTSGLYDSADAGARTVTAAFTLGNITGMPGTLASNYTLPFTATGAGMIDPKVLTAVIVGNPTKTYDALAAATLAPENYLIAGFAPGEGATVTQNSGSYASAHAGIHAVSTTLATGDFVANGGTVFANYVLPVSATGLGTISTKVILGAITGFPVKPYDGTDAASLISADYLLSGFVGSDGATVGQTAALYGSRDAGLRTVTAFLSAGDFAATGTTDLTNYSLPATVSGLGRITALALGVAITGTPTRVYDGTAVAALTPQDYTLTGFLAGERAAVTQTSGLYDGVHAGPHGVTASLSAADFAAADGTNLANYVLPVAASGTGAIVRREIRAAIVGNPTKRYDGTAVATLMPENFLLAGFVGGEGAAVTQTQGTYDSENPGQHTVTAALSPGDFTAIGATDFSDYSLPEMASGPGTISPSRVRPPIVPIPVFTAAIVGTTPLGIIPYPSSSTLSTVQSKAFGVLPAIVLVSTREDTVTGTDEYVAAGGSTLMHSSGQIMLQSTNEKSWRLIFPVAGGSVDLGSPAEVP